MQAYSSSFFLHSNKSGLIVNHDPDIPLRVPLEKSSSLNAIKVQDLKNRNLQRFEKVAQNLNSLAEQDKLDYLEKLRIEKQKLKTVEENYQNERRMH